MLAVVLKGPTLLEALQQIQRVKADFYEFRLDLFSSFNLDEIKQLNVPKILKGVKVKEYQKILSYHNFDSTPDNLSAIYEKMRKKESNFYKIATFANSILDTMRILLLQKEAGSKLIAIAMGELGRPSRLLGPIFGTPITYASIDDQPVAPGQFSIEELRQFNVNQNTAIYGLIGDPVTQSVSHLSHNACFKKFGLNAIYVKFQVKPKELGPFLGIAKQLNFKGLSITAPHKEAVLPFLDEIDPLAKEIGAVNTLHFQNGKLIGYNTDYIGAKNALSKHIDISGKRIHLFGAGGVAKAIAHMCIAEKAHLTIQNRTKEKALLLCEKYQITYSEALNCDCAINCTDHDFTIPDVPFAMDIKTRPKESLFLQNKHKIYGYEMFIEQAIAQFKIWLNLDEDKCRQILTHETLKALMTPLKT